MLENVLRHSKVKRRDGDTVWAHTVVLYFLIKEFSNFCICGWRIFCILAAAF